MTSECAVCVTVCLHLESVKVEAAHEVCSGKFITVKYVFLFIHPDTHLQQSSLLVTMATADQGSSD